MTQTAPTHRAIEAVWRIESARIIAGLVRAVRDMDLAEEACQDAFLAALAQWPKSGIPENPGAWLTTTARRRAIDRIRRQRRLTPIGEELARRPPGAQGPDIPSILDSIDGAVEDDVLRLIFMACHPEISAEARAAITLRLVCGLSTEEIARAFLVSEPTIAQRIVRAKRTLVDQQIPFEVPTGQDLAPRLDSVLEAIYLLFNEGYSATAGAEWTRPDLCAEAQRLGRMLAAMLPSEPEAQGLLALMELQASRLAARTDAEGRPILLNDQDRSRWDQLLIRRGLAALDRAFRCAGGEPGPYTLQAAIAACHALAPAPGRTDWARISALYEALMRKAPSPVVALNHAVAVAMDRGPQAGLELLDRLAAEPALRSYHLLPSVRGELLRRMGRTAEAEAEVERAASLATNERERELLLDRARAIRAGDETD
ncbi:MAG: RNA polymerase sigma factor [Phycisphaerales bacterium]|nr:RNA polymerase sigma factor [Phycisphaerales bacterium]